jgi:hypothetical protein
MGLAGKEAYCSTKCKNEAEAAQGGGGSGSHESSGGQSNQSSGVFGKIGKAMDDSSERKESRLEARVDSIASMEFGSTPEELSNDLNKLVTMGSGTKDTEIRKAIAEKMEFAIMQLRNSGKEAEAEFFDKKRKKIKPKWYD